MENHTELRRVSHSNGADPEKTGRHLERWSDTLTGSGFAISFAACNDGLSRVCCCFGFRSMYRRCDLSSAIHGDENSDARVSKNSRG